MQNPFRYFNSSPAIIRLAVMMYVRFPLSLRQVEDLLGERGIDICHETVRFWWNRFGPLWRVGIYPRTADLPILSRCEVIAVDQHEALVMAKHRIDGVISC